MPERLLVLSLRILRTFCHDRLDSEHKAARVLSLNRKSEALLKEFSPATEPTKADSARLELIRYLNTVNRKKLMRQL